MSERAASEKSALNPDFKALFQRSSGLATGESGLGVRGCDGRRGLQGKRSGRIAISCWPIKASTTTSEEAVWTDCPGHVGQNRPGGLQWRRSP
nr:hypothetical protein [Bacillaceae bacterium]